MQRYFVFIVSVALASALNAQSIAVHGKVTNTSGQAVNGAVVELERAGLKDTTGTDGGYTLAENISAVRPPGFTQGKSQKEPVLRIRIGGTALVSAEVFDARGAHLKHAAAERVPAGFYVRDIGEDRPAKQAKLAATVDTLKVTAAGYRTKRVPVASWDTTADITVEPDTAAGKNLPVKSVGCGKTLAITTGKKTISSGGEDRTYIIDIPANYDPNKPYRLFYCSHWIGSTSEAVRDQNYYFLKPLATAANEPAIFIAPQSQGSTWLQKDHALFDDLLAMAKANLCIDETRVFATGFSFGGMITYSLSTNHQKQIRAAVGIAPANYNIWLPNPKLKEPIAWMQTTGMGDGTCPWINGNSTSQGSKYIALEHAADNGCTLPATLPTWQQGAHICYDFQGCATGYPVKACTFNGGHTNIASDPGGNENWIPKESWKFFTQF